MGTSVCVIIHGLQVTFCGYVENGGKLVLMLGALAIHNATILLEDDGEEPGEPEEPEEPEEVGEAGPGFAASCFMVFMSPIIGAMNSPLDCLSIPINILYLTRFLTYTKCPNHTTRTFSTLSQDVPIWMQHAVSAPTNQARP